MPKDEKMTIDERYKYLRKMKKRYQKASRKEKSSLLNEMTKVTDMHRKALIRVLKSDLQRKPRHKQRERSCKGDVAYAVGLIAESLDYVCPERLQPNFSTSKNGMEHLSDEKQSGQNGGQCQ